MFYIDNGLLYFGSIGLNKILRCTSPDSSDFLLQLLGSAGPHALGLMLEGLPVGRAASLHGEQEAGSG